MHKSTLLWLQSISIAAHDIYPLGVRLPVFDVLWLGLRPECQQGTTLHIYHSKPIQIASAGILTLWTQASASELLRAPTAIIAQQSSFRVKMPPSPFLVMATKSYFMPIREEVFALKEFAQILNHGHVVSLFGAEMMIWERFLIPAHISVTQSHFLPRTKSCTASQPQLVNPN